MGWLHGASTATHTMCMGGAAWGGCMRWLHGAVAWGIQSPTPCAWGVHGASTATHTACKHDETVRVNAAWAGAGFEGPWG